MNLIKELYESGTPDMEKSPESLAVQAFRAFWFYSHSTVAGGLLVMS